MGTTTRESLRYPDGNVIPNATQFQNLAEDIESVMGRFRRSNGGKFLAGVAMYQESSPNLAGYLVIQTNMNFVTGTSIDQMLRFDFSGYTYWAVNNVIEASLNFYALNGGVQNPEFTNSGTMDFKEVRIMRNNSTNKLAIALLPHIPAGTDVWHYPKFNVDIWTAWGAEIADSDLNATTITRVTSLTGYTTVSTVQNNWQTLSLANGWVAWGVGHVTPRYRRNGVIVEVQGLAKNGPIGGDIGSLPVGYRPTGGTLIFTALTGAGLGRVDVMTNGAIVPQGGSNDYFSLDRIRFPLDTG